MESVSQYFSRVSRSGVDLTLLTCQARWLPTSISHPNLWEGRDLHALARAYFLQVEAAYHAPQNVNHSIRKFSNRSTVRKNRQGQGSTGSVPKTPDPDTSAKVSRYKWEPYRDTNWWRIYYFLPRRGHTFTKASRYKWEVYRDTFQKYRCQGSIWLSWV